MGLRLRFIKGRRTIDIEPFKWPAAATGVVAGMYTLGRMFFRRMSKDNLEITLDRTETNLVVGQYDRIRELETANRDLVGTLLAKTAELGELRGEVRALNVQITAMEKSMVVLQLKIDVLTNSKNG